MALIHRLASRQLGSLMRNERTSLMPFLRPVTLKAQKALPPSEEGHDERNMKLGRPQSPHLTIYEIQLTSTLSISHRFTGMALTAYATGIGFTALALPPESISHGLDALATMQLGSGVIVVGKFLLAFPLTYHFFNGIRHLCWDMGKFLTLKEIYLTGYTMLALSLGSAIALALM